MNKRNISNIKKGLIIGGIALTLFLGMQWVLKYLRVDACLDNGGVWNYDLKKCEDSHTLDTIHIADYYWKAYNDTILNREYLKRGTMLDSISESPNELIEVLNMRDSESKVDFVEITGDTIVIRILNDTFLTQQMGTLGAECYMAETVYTLTEIDSIKFVWFEMDYGSHANPGLYSREDYEKMIRK